VLVIFYTVIWRRKKKKLKMFLIYLFIKYVYIHRGAHRARSAVHGREGSRKVGRNRRGAGRPTAGGHHLQSVAGSHCSAAVHQCQGVVQLRILCNWERFILKTEINVKIYNYRILSHSLLRTIVTTRLTPSPMYEFSESFEITDF